MPEKQNGHILHIVNTLFVHADRWLCWQGVRLGVRPDAPPLPRPTRTVKVETGCNVGNPCVSSPCPTHSRCSDQWERHTCICEPGKVPLFLSHFYPLSLLMDKLEIHWDSFLTGFSVNIKLSCWFGTACLSAFHILSHNWWCNDSKNIFFWAGSYWDAEKPEKIWLLTAWGVGDPSLHETQKWML